MESNSPDKTTKNNDRKPGFDKRSAFYEYVKTKRDKLHAQFDPNKVDPELASSKIFEGVSCYFTGCAEYDELRDLLVQNGGRFDHFLSKSNTTHIISDQLAEAKKKSLKNALIVKSSWIYECIKAGKLLPTADYLLFKPLGIVDLFNGKSLGKTNKGGPLTRENAVEKEPSAVSTRDSLTNDAISSEAQASVNSVPVSMDDEITEPSPSLNHLLESPSKHSMNDKNLNSASVSINNVRCTVSITLRKYIGEASCQLHIRLRELYLKGKSLTLTVGVKKSVDSAGRQAPIPTSVSENKTKSSLDLISRSTILPRASNDVNLINSYTKGLMSTIKSAPISHIRMIRIEMTQLEKCTDEEIAQWTSNAAAAQSIPTFTTPLDEDRNALGECIPVTSPRKQKSPEPEIIGISGPPAKKKSTLDVPDEPSTSKSPAKKTPTKAKSKSKASSKPATGPVKSGPLDQFFLKKPSSTNTTNTNTNTSTNNKAIGEGRVGQSSKETDAPSNINSSEDSNNRVDLSNLSKVFDPVTLLREWVITSGEKAEDYDLFLVNKFLGTLVTSHNLTKLKSCMDALYEEILQRNQISWKEAFNEVSSFVRHRIDSSQSDQVFLAFTDSLCTFELVSY